MKQEILKVVFSGVLILGLAQNGFCTRSEIKITDSNGFTRIASEVEGPGTIVFEVVNNTNQAAGGAEVLLTNLANNQTMTTTSNERGIATFNGVAPGTWTVSSKTAGIKIANATLSTDGKDDIRAQFVPLGAAGAGAGVGAAGAGGAGGAGAAGAAGAGAGAGAAAAGTGAAAAGAGAAAAGAGAAAAAGAATAAGITVGTVATAGAVTAGAVAAGTVATDNNGDSVANNNADEDADGDGIANADDPDFGDENSSTADSDGDGVPNNIDEEPYDSGNGTVVSPT